MMMPMMSYTKYDGEVPVSVNFRSINAVAMGGVEYTAPDLITLYAPRVPPVRITVGNPTVAQMAMGIIVLFLTNTGRLGKDTPGLNAYGLDINSLIEGLSKLPIPAEKSPDPLTTSDKSE